MRVHWRQSEIHTEDFIHRPPAITFIVADKIVHISVFVPPVSLLTQKDPQQAPDNHLLLEYIDSALWLKL